ncbi:MAG: methyl-accepting chemotaxis protein [Anaerolineales bacterium]|nr:methyl-accepting chemotaxis protein [Anaerolineales bacterium]
MSWLTARFNLTHWKIANKVLALVLAVVCLAVGLLTAFTYWAVAADAAERTRTELQLLAGEIVQRAAEPVQASVGILETLALSPDVVATAAAGNLTAAVVTAEDVAALDQAWKDGAPAAEPLVAQLEQNGLSGRLRQFAQQFPQFVEVFVTDARGLNVAMTARTGDYLQADEGWWEAAYAGGTGALYIGDFEYDDSTKTWAVNIGVPIYAAGAPTVVGILRGTADISHLVQTLAAVRFGQTGQVLLVDRAGSILYSKLPAFMNQPLPEGRLKALAEAGQSTAVGGIPDLVGRAAIVADAPLTGPMAEPLGWSLFVQQDEAEVRAGLVTVVVQALLVALAVAFLLGLAGWGLARSISAPVVLATREARQLAQGDVRAVETAALSHLVQRQDEAGELLRAFQDLRAYLHRAAEAAGRLAEGDLSRDLTAQGEADVLGQAFLGMVATLRGLVGQVADHARVVTTASEQLAATATQAGQATNQIAATIQQVARGTTHQAETVSHTAAAMEEMKRVIDGVAVGAQAQAQAVSQAAAVTGQITAVARQVAANAETVSREAASTAAAAQAGARTVTATIHGMDSIRAKVGVAADKVREMGQRSDQIGAIVQTIDDIASQTNLLALNAAIEAARAGEHGKGFAVVADEVRKLAERASAATKEIGGLIKGIQLTVGEAVRAMDEGAQEVAGGAAQAREAGAALAAITQAATAVQGQAEAALAAMQRMNSASEALVQATEAVSVVVEQNTTATVAMTSGSAEVLRAVEGLASVSEENSAAVEQVSAAAEEMTAQVTEVGAAAQALAQMAGDLRSLVGRFTLAEANAQPDRAAARRAPQAIRPASPARVPAANGRH